jgi:hypothetical protein
LLLDLPQRKPDSDDARLLADIVNLDDFGVVGLMQTMSLLAHQGDGVDALLDGAAKRDQYGYWDARLRDGFHFDAIRDVARARLSEARSVIEQLRAELP